MFVKQSFPRLLCAAMLCKIFDSVERESPSLTFNYASRGTLARISLRGKAYPTSRLRCDREGDEKENITNKRTAMYNILYTKNIYSLGIIAMSEKKLSPPSLRSPNSHIIHLHRLPTDRRGRRRLPPGNRIRKCASHGDVQHEIETLLHGLRPHGRTKLILRESPDEFPVEPEFHLFGFRGAVDDDFVDVEVSDAGAAGAGAGGAETAGLIAGAARVDVLGGGE